MRIVSWNVNGLRACAKKGFLDVLERSKADVVGIQEVRAFEDQLPDAVRAPPGWHTHFVAAERAGYSGVGLFSRTEPDQVEDSLGEPRFDIEGRYQLARFGKVVVVNGYFPKGSGKDRDNSRVPYKLDFYRAVFDRVERLRRRYRVFVIGDWNTAHNADRSRPPQGERQEQRFPPRGARGDGPLDGGRVERHLSQAQPGCAGTLLVVEAVGRGARKERRVAHRLRDRLARRDAQSARCVHLAARDGLGPLPGRESTSRTEGRARRSDGNARRTFRRARLDSQVAPCGGYSPTRGARERGRATGPAVRDDGSWWRLTASYTGLSKR